MRVVWICFPALLLATPPVDEPAAFFETKVRPVLAAKCYACHTNSKLGGLRLDSREAILQGGKSGPALVAGKPEESLLIQAVSGRHERLKMPPTGPLPETEVANLVAWVKAGAVWPATPTAAAPVAAAKPSNFWSFQPIRKPAVPEVANGKWPRGVIDRFVLARLEQQKLEPVEPADRATLIRRATFDLSGLPPTPEEVDAFVNDASPDAFAKVVNRLLESPRYGERWGRYWLDFARYADGALGASKDSPYENAYRYRDWLISALNRDLPYNRMVEAQIAADLFDTADKPEYLPALGFQALGDDKHERLDVTTKTFLGLTVGCARCHDHKFDPIPTADYYSLYGVFTSTADFKIPLVPEEQVKAYKAAKDKVDQKQEEIDDFIRFRSTELGEMFVKDTARYVVAAWHKQHGGSPAIEGLEPVILDRWVEYLKDPRKEHPYLKDWPAQTSATIDVYAAKFEEFVVRMFLDKHDIEDRNYVKLGGAKGAKDEHTRQYTNLESLEIEKYYLWRDLASDPFQRNGAYFPGGIYYFGLTSRLLKDFENRGVTAPQVQDIDRFLSGPWKRHLDRLRAELAVLKKAMPAEYPYLHGVKDADKPGNSHIHVRGDDKNLGPEVPRHFLSALSPGEPVAFSHGSGRLEFAKAVTAHPLAARVMANRLWVGHFGQGIVRSPSNFGQLGDRPTHPELLDYLAARLIESGWSLKTLHREIMLSSTYALSTKYSERHAAVDADNRLLWRANLNPRLDAESLRDSMLFVAGKLSAERGGPPVPLDDKNMRRTVYGYIGRTTLDPMLSLFDFPNPNNTSEQRSITLGPMQRLYFMNNEFVARQADAFAARVKELDASDDERIKAAYRLAYGRTPSEDEARMSKDFLRASGGSWPQLTQALLTSAEFSSVN